MMCRLHGVVRALAALADVWHATIVRITETDGQLAIHAYGVLATPEPLLERYTLGLVPND
jgi:hypothetical protein